MADNQTCAKPGCSEPVRAKRLCPAHYQQHRKAGLLPDSGLVPEDRLHRHLGRLAQLGWTASAISRATGSQISHSAVSEILAGTRKRVQARTARLLLAIELAAPLGLVGCHFRLDLPWPHPPLTSDTLRGDPRACGERVQCVRRGVMVLAKRRKIPKARHLTVRLHYAPGTWDRIDGQHLRPTAYAAVDALTRLRLVPAYRDEFVAVPSPEILRPPEPGPRCWLTIEGGAVSDPIESFFEDHPEIAAAPIRFWVCPDEQHRHTGIVEWRGDIAYCLEPGCGRNSGETKGKRP